MKRLLQLSIVFGALVALGLLLVPRATAITGASWRAGNIINDTLFYDSNAMSVADIQSFLNSLVPTCDTWGTQMYSSTQTRAQYGTSVGAPAPFICVRDYYENPTTHETNFNPAATVPSGALSAAQIIYNVSQQFKINPKALLVTLKKEAAVNLIEDDWPMLWQYRTAMGFGCPDTAPCDSQYYGFYNQMYNAAKQFRLYADYPDSYRRKAGGTYAIQYHPTNTACASPNVYIEDSATAGLYNYTPYQPNAAALANLYGTGDACSSYGNRNFWRVWTDWFGSPVDAPKSNYYIPDGTYALVGVGSGKSLEVAGGNTGNGTPVQIYSTNSTAAQKWRITQDGDGYYSLMNIASGRYLDVSNASINTGARIQIWDGNGTCAQKWSLFSYGSAVYLLSKCSGYTLDITSGSTADGSKLQLWDKNYSNAQLWKLVSQSPASMADGLYEISVSGGLALQTAGGSTINGTKVQLGMAEKSAAQYWQFTRQNDGLYTVRNPESGKYLDVTNASVVAGADIQIFQGGSTCAQRWLVSLNSGDGTYTILSACSDLSLDVRGGLITTEGAQLQTWESNGSGAQKFYLGAMTELPANGTYSLLSLGNKALEISGGNTTSGTKVQLWSANRSASQYWQLTRQDDGTYTVKNPASGKYLDVSNGSIAKGSLIQIWDGNSTCAQRWNISLIHGSTLSLSSACTASLSIDIQNGAVSTNGTNAQLFTSNNTGAQLWRISSP